MKIAFLGLGLIGGSVARAVAEAGWADSLSAWSPSGTGPRAAVGHGIVPASTPREAVRDAALVVLAAPPLACLALVDDLAGDLANSLVADVVVTDVAGTKAAISARAHDRGIRFVGGHPMAGREVGGYEAADPDLFRDRPWVIVPPDPADPAAEELVTGLAAACGARPVRMVAADHDTAVAGISHLPLIVSAALVEAVAGSADWPAAAGLAAGGWASMSRLARGDVEMGAGMLATNADAVSGRLRAFRDVIDAWLGELGGAAPDPDALRRRLAAARDRAMTTEPGPRPGAVGD